MQKSLDLVTERQIDNKSSLIQQMAWQGTGDKPWPGAILAKSFDAAWRHQVTMSYKTLDMYGWWRYGSVFVALR